MVKALDIAKSISNHQFFGPGDVYLLDLRIRGCFFLVMRSWRFLDAGPEKVKKPMAEKKWFMCRCLQNPRWKTLRPRSFYGFVQAFGYYSSCLDCTTSTSEPWRVKRPMPMSKTWVASSKPLKFTMNWVILYVIHNIYIYIPWAPKPWKI